MNSPGYKWLLACATAALIAFCGALFVRGGDRQRQVAPTAPPHPSKAEIQTNALAAIQKHRPLVSELRDRVERSRESAEPSLEEAIDAGRLKTEERIALLDDVLAQEQRNSSWEGEVRSTADELSTFEEFGDTLLEEVHCGQSLCKARFRHESLEGQHLFFKNRNRGRAWNTNQFGTLNKEPDDITTTVYFSPEGAKLPDAQEEMDEEERDLARAETTIKEVNSNENEIL